MNKISIDLSKTVGKIKRMNAVNNGPKVPRDPRMGQNTGNMEDYKNLYIPYARTHDAALCGAYGGEHIIDIHCIFPDFDADVNAPESYDFYLTDLYLKTIEAVGTKPFYRLGESIEFRQKKYGINVPKDMQKWAEICEHIIRHYNEGWADGFHMNIEYWEIWNEADGDMADELSCRRTWMGTPEEFYELYAVSATHLKKCFPNLKIGGPAVSSIYPGSWMSDFENNQGPWTDNFFKYISERNAPLDFFSWHCYCQVPEVMVECEKKAHKYLAEYGYENAESILNEWNYVTDFSGEEWIYSLETMRNMKGATFAGACICAMQNTTLDMLMYYDARIGTGMNGLFQGDRLAPGSTYYVYRAFSELYRMGNQVKADVSGENIYTVAAKNDNDDYGCMICYYTDEERADNKVIELEINNAKDSEVDFYLTDGNSNERLVKREFSNTSKTVLYFDMEPNTVLFVKSKDLI